MAKLLSWYCRRGTFSLFLCWIVGAVLYALPAAHRETVHQTVRDAATPGSSAFTEAHDHAIVHLSSLQKWLTTQLAEVPTAAILPPAQHQDLLVRQLELQVAKLHAQVESYHKEQQQGDQVPQANPLLIPNLLPAKVIGRERNEARKSIDRLIDAGRRQGIADGDFVMEAALLEAPFDTNPSILLDQGAKAGVQVDQPVYAGRIVVGRVRQVGQWSSTVQLVQDADFRASAQLVRQSTQGPVLGARGLFRGAGSNGVCKLTLVAATEPVAVGDAVYTSEAVGGHEVRMLLGHVTQAQLLEGSPEWRIDVAPASIHSPLQVEILRLDLNPTRVAIESPDPASPPAAPL